MFATELSCTKCSKKYSLGTETYECRSCNGTTEIVYDYEAISKKLTAAELSRRIQRNIWRYNEVLPLQPEDALTLGEGCTPLSRLRSESGPNFILKLDYMCPTGSFKDRGSVTLISKAQAIGRRAVAIDSSGNASASLSAYAAYAGIGCYVFTPTWASPGKLIQSIVSGAKVVKVDGDREDVHRMARLMCHKHGAYYCGFQSNPYALEGMKTIAYEIWEDLGFRIPAWVVLPVGAGNSLLGCWKGFTELVRLGLTEGVPRLACIQPEGCCPIVESYEKKRSDVAPFHDEPKTVAEGLRIGAPSRGELIMRSLRETNGTACKVSDREILEAGRGLAKSQGIFVEPSAAAALAGARKLVDERVVQRDQEAVIFLTGSGLKTPEAYGIEGTMTVKPEERELARLVERF